MSLLTLFSSTAIVIGLCAALPQLAAMLRARSAAGQSSLGCEARRRDELQLVAA
ncbi:MAG TPA: hypothetical protein VK501_23455 [Baekduia sp.]|uniref:hypothetical protein n=1 Tax=Baekduia sp. TaxID=2600305 RepID=UPI002B9A63BE|nr:hypothetical protein [Baekduia sp.]HMJ36882.1 hypothetical protein [Baekduia sp.]